MTMLSYTSLLQSDCINLLCCVRRFRHCCTRLQSKSISPFTDDKPDVPDASDLPCGPVILNCLNRACPSFAAIRAAVASVYYDKLYKTCPRSPTQASEHFSGLQKKCESLYSVSRTMVCQSVATICLGQCRHRQIMPSMVYSTPRPH